MPTGILPTPPGDPGPGAGIGIPSLPAQPLLSFPQIPLSAPQNYSSNEFSSTGRGIASLSFAGRTWRFRTNPNSVKFSYILNTHVDQTFGGRVVQILSCKMEDLVVVVEAGRAGWPYAATLALFLRDFLDYQRNPSAPPGVFTYTTRGWTFKVYQLSIPFQDQVEATTRPLELHFKIQEDVSGVVSGAILDATLAKLQDGLGWRRDKFTSGSAYGPYKGPNSGTNTPIPSPTTPGTPGTPPAPGAPQPSVVPASTGLPLDAVHDLATAPSASSVVNI